MKVLVRARNSRRKHWKGGN